MSDQHWEPFHNDAGEQVGWVTQAEDENLVGVNLDGDLVAAVNQAGETVDHSAYQFTPADQQLPDQRPDDAQQEYAQQQAEAYQQQVLNDIESQVANVEATLHRALTVSELDAITTRAANDLQAGRNPDVWEITSRMAGEGRPLHNIDDQSDRLAYMTERLDDAERLQRGDDVTAPAPPSRETYDLDNETERIAWMTDRADGRLDPDTASAAAYSSSNDTAASNQDDAA